MNTFNASYIGLRNDLIKHIEGVSLNILDVGCATGVNGRYLLNNGIAKNVVGIEYDQEMAKIAAGSNNKIFCGDLNDAEFIDEVLRWDGSYDVVIFGDILEHLYDPWSVLKRLTCNLNANAQIIISLPNIQHIETFIQVYIKGVWPRNPRGIFDQTHLRWFTYKDALDLINQANLSLVTYDPSYRSRDPIGSRFTWKYKIIKLLNPQWVTFQHRLVCKYEN